MLNGILRLCGIRAGAVLLVAVSGMLFPGTACTLVDTNCDPADASCNSAIALVIAREFIPVTDPTTLTPDAVSGLQVRLAADNIIGLTDGQGVSYWADASGNGNDAGQTMGGLQPVWRESLVNGLPVVRFDGTDDGMTIADAAGYKSTAVTVFMVAKDNGTAGLGIIFGYPQEASSHTTPFFRWVFSRHFNNSGSIGIRLATDDFTTTQNTAWSNYTIYSYKTSPRVVYVNGSVFIQVPGQDIAYPNGAGLLLGRNAAGGEPFSGDVAEILLYDSGLSDANRSGIECWLSAKYGIAVAQTC